MSDSARSQLFALLLVGLIMLTTVGLPLAVPHPTTDGTSELSPVQEAKAQSGGQIVCSMNVYLTQNRPCDIQFNTGVEKNLDHLQAYQKAVSKVAARKTVLDIIGNYAKDTKDVAFLIAEREIYKAIVNGSSKAVALSKAKTSVTEYYETKQFNYLDFWNQYVVAQDNIHSTAPEAIYAPKTMANPKDASTVQGVNYKGLRTRTVEFQQLNKSLTVQQVKLRVNWKDKDGVSDSEPFWFDPISEIQHSLTGAQKTEIAIDGPFQTVARPPSPDNGPQQVYIYGPIWDEYEKLESTKQEVLNDINSYVENTYAKFESGKLDPEQVLSQVNQINNFIAEVNPKGGSFDEVSAFLEASGMATPDNASYMDIRYRPYSDTSGTDFGANRTLNGLLASTNEPPTGDWEVNRTYETNNLEGSQTVALIEGGYQQLDGRFEIQNVYNENGEDVGSVNITTETRDYSVSNTTELQNRTQRLQEQIDKLQKLQRTTVVTSGKSAGTGFVQGIANALGNLVGNPFDGVVPGVPGKSLTQILVLGVAAILGVRVLTG
ncbi:hypothetical protein GRX03_11940 [Halovenus sp. WSH3]|uniref:Envelope protein N-terminal domain-containing protein n=1 Tax=Halovenus carboxidivorans TaxID=2692199 RepID=A0A6B0TBN1_9EURY|nr:hypothetical protein [Halovenus carboxidivorans]MXR52310.1 hypothetical protein [Halovenus carboxidivorans]